MRVGVHEHKYVRVFMIVLNGIELLGCFVDVFGESIEDGVAQQPMPADAAEEASRERQIIEDALAGSRGRVSGANGAAARLGVPPSTLEHRIKKLRIRKSHFKLS
jgi:transcriptional regulator with GAF, ATPase, and Fis domain